MATKKKDAPKARRAAPQEPSAYESRRVPNLRYQRQVEARQRAAAEADAAAVESTISKEG